MKVVKLIEKKPEHYEVSVHNSGMLINYILYLRDKGSIQFPRGWKGRQIVRMFPWGIRQLKNEIENEISRRQNAV